MAFCTKCGSQLADGAKFCANCGASIVQRPTSQEDRMTVYDGVIHKCPNCGEILDSFEIRCPTCDCELRNSRNTSSVKWLEFELNRIETLKLKKKEKFNQKINLIKNFPIPNAKEDIIEFFVMAKSNIDTECLCFLGGQDLQKTELSKAWLSKMEQAYLKAEIALRNSIEFESLKNSYIQEKRNKKEASLKYNWYYCYSLRPDACIITFNLGCLTKGESMSLFKKNKKVGVFADVIRCDEPSYLIWKWHPNGTESGEHKREYAIRWGSVLRVKDGEVAVFVYKQNNGMEQDYIIGPCDEKLKTSNLPVLSEILGAFYGGDTPFQAEIYFINLAKLIQVKFAVPYFDMCDPRYPDFTVPVSVRGTISFKIDNYREFIRLHKLESFNLEDFKSQIKDAVSRHVKGVVAGAPITHNIPVVQIETKLWYINADVERELKERLERDFGVVASAVDISAIEIDKSSSGYRQLMAITADVVTATVQGQADANIEHYAETLRIQREEGQYATHKRTQTENLGAFEIEKRAEVGVAGAQALGRMGENNAGGVDLGCGSFNPVAMTAGMAVGGAIGQNIASVIGATMTEGASTPPPIPTVAYHVAKNGQSTGPFNLERLSEMAKTGELLPQSLVWKQGMPNWVRADSVDELKGLFPPPIV